VKTCGYSVNPENGGAFAPEPDNSFLKSSFWYFPSECNPSNRNQQFGLNQGDNFPLDSLYAEEYSEADVPLLIKGLKIMTTSPSQSPSFPGLTGEPRKALDARLRPAGMTRQQEWNFRVCQFNNEILNNF
jgi:hypothetical protein